MDKLSKEKAIDSIRNDADFFREEVDSFCEGSRSPTRDGGSLQ